MVRPARFLPLPLASPGPLAAPLAAPARARVGPRGLPAALPDGSGGRAASVPPIGPAPWLLSTRASRREAGRRRPPWLFDPGGRRLRLPLRRLRQAAAGAWARGGLRVRVLAARKTRQVSRGGASGAGPPRAVSIATGGGPRAEAPCSGEESGRGSPVRAGRASGGPGPAACGAVGPRGRRGGSGRRAEGRGGIQGRARRR